MDTWRRKSGQEAGEDSVHGDGPPNGELAVRGGIQHDAVLGRVGFTGCDWGSAWLLELAAAGLPGEDFILKAPNSSGTSFASRIADFSDGQAAMRALLVKAGMTVKSGMENSCHSWRHFYPSAGAQLDVHPEAVDAMGHWSPGTGMGALYDGMACVSELFFF